MPSDVFVDDADGNDVSYLSMPNHSSHVESASSNQTPPDEQESIFKTKGVLPQKRIVKVTANCTRGDAFQCSASLLMIVQHILEILTHLDYLAQILIRNRQNKQR